MYFGHILPFPKIFQDPLPITNHPTLSSCPQNKQNKQQTFQNTTKTTSKKKNQTNDNRKNTNLQTSKSIGGKSLWSLYVGQRPLSWHGCYIQCYSDKTDFSSPSRYK